MPTAQRIAYCYQRHVAALRAAAVVVAWLDSCWRPNGPPEPAPATAIVFTA
jgi:hypothetical protein